MIWAGQAPFLLPFFLKRVLVPPDMFVEFFWLSKEIPAKIFAPIVVVGFSFTLFQMWKVLSKISASWMTTAAARGDTR